MGVGLGGAAEAPGAARADRGSRGQQAAGRILPQHFGSKSQPIGPGPGSLSLAGSKGGLDRFLCKRPCLAEAGLVAPAALEAEDAAVGRASRDADVERSPSPQGQDLRAGISAAVAMPDWSAVSLIDDPEAELLLVAAAKDPSLCAGQIY